MFRRLPDSLQEDPSWEADLVKLGYFINEHSQIRQIRKPTERFNFKITDNDRFNEVHKEAFHSKYPFDNVLGTFTKHRNAECLRKEIRTRMKQLNMSSLYLPQLTIKKPKVPSVPIFITRQDIMKTKKSVIIIVNDSMQDLGVWAWRKVCDDGFDVGSCTGTIKKVKLRYPGTESEPGVVIMNPGQYYYSHKEKRALTHESWEALPRKSLFHPTVRADEKYNMVDGARSREEHIATVFEKVIKNTAYVDQDADLYLIGIGHSSPLLLRYLDENWSSLSSRVKAAAWTHPYIEVEKLNADLVRFIETRSRAWALSNAPLGTCIGMPDHGQKTVRPEPDAPREWEDEDDEWDEEFACPTFSGEEEEYTECIFPKVQKAMMEFFQEVRRGGQEYVNPSFEVVKPAKPSPASLDEVDGNGDAGTVFKVKDANSQGDILPPGATVEKVTEEIKKVQLADDEVEVAGVAVAKDLLAKAGLD